MSIIKKLEDAAVYGPVPCPVAQDAAALLQDIRGYLVAAADSSMSRNNSELLASELLQRIDS